MEEPIKKEQRQKRIIEAKTYTVPVSLGEINENISIPGIRIFSSKRSLALAAWLGGLEPVKLVQESNQLILEAGQEERWLITDMDLQTTNFANRSFSLAREKANGLQFISVQSKPEKEFFDGFWMLRDIENT